MPADGSLGQKKVAIATPGTVQLEGSKKGSEQLAVLKTFVCSIYGQIRSNDENPRFPPLQSIAGGSVPEVDS